MSHPIKPVSRMWAQTPKEIAVVQLNLSDFSAILDKHKDNSTDQ